MSDFEMLKLLVSSTDDLSRYAENDALLEQALSYAVSEVNKRRCYSGDGYEEKFKQNVINGAVDYLSKLGGQEYQSFSENGVSASFREVPLWLMSVTPKLRVM